MFNQLACLQESDEELENLHDTFIAYDQLPAEMRLYLAEHPIKVCTLCLIVRSVMDVNQKEFEQVWRIMNPPEDDFYGFSTIEVGLEMFRKYPETQKRAILQMETFLHEAGLPVYTQPLRSIHEQRTRHHKNRRVRARHRSQSRRFVHTLR